ncbi:MAG: DUF362 domain-containing protein [Candidatus Uhrbacteria bacterium]|nr:DUF362 domain-containing protein [Candidatus Uhrbacteria bacterium]
MPKVCIETGEYRRKVVKDVVDALGDAFIEHCKKATLIFVKVNLVHHENQLADTHVDAVRGVLDVIRTHTGTPVVVGDAAYHGTKAAFRHLGYERLPEEYSKVMLVDLNDDAYVDGTITLGDGTPMTIRRSKMAHDADFTLSLTNMKTHRDTGVSLAVKNWSLGTWIVPPRIGMTGRVWSRSPWLHEQGSRAHHRAIADLFAQRPCDVAVIDGILAMEGDGPTRGTPVPMHLALAGFDAVAVDAIGATLMGVDPHAVGYLEFCAELGLGVNDMAKIDFPPAVIAQCTRMFQLPQHTRDHLQDWRL